MSIQEALKQEFVAPSLPTKRLVELYKKYALPTLGITLSDKQVSTMKPPELIGPIQRALAAIENRLVINTVMTKAEFKKVDKNIQNQTFDELVFPEGLDIPTLATKAGCTMQGR